MHTAQTIHPLKLLASSPDYRNLSERESYLAGHGVGLSDLVTPIASPHGDDGQLGQDDGTADGSGHLFGALHSQTHMAVVVTNGDEGLKWGGERINVSFYIQITK